MKKAFVAFSVLIITLLCSISVFAIDTDDSGMWEYQTYGSGVELTKYSGTQTDVYVPSKITKGETEYSVLKLGDKLFKENTALNSATLGEGITEIGASAFEGATGLVCIVPPKSLTTIGANAFSGCINFNSVILYNEVTNIGEKAFEDCDKVTIYCNDNSFAQNYAQTNEIRYILLNSEGSPTKYTIDGITYHIQNGEAVVISYSGTEREVVIPTIVNGFPVREIMKSAFWGKIVTHVVLPHGLRRVGEEAFCYCSSLEDIQIPEGLQYIDTRAFSGCTELKEINLPESIISIGSYAFSSCAALTEITIPDNITDLNKYVFSNCVGLTKVNLPEKLTNIGERAFYMCTALTEINIPETLVTIGPYAFYSCGKLEGELSFPDSMTSIGDLAFSKCSNITDVKFGSGLKTFVWSAFDTCTGLVCIEIPETVTMFSGEPRGFALIVKEGSYAHNYAVDNEIMYYLKGSESPEIYVVDGIEYAVKNGEAAAFGVTANAPDTVVMPQYVKGYPVKSLKRGFSGTILHLTLPETITEILPRTFRYQSIQTINLPKGLKSIGKEAFAECKGLDSITLPEGITTIEEDTFLFSSLRSITLPDSLVSIEDGAFYSNQYYASRLKTVHVSSLINWCNISFNGECTNPVSLGAKLIVDGQEVGSHLILPEGLTSMKNNSFSGFKTLEKVTFPQSLTEIGHGAFTNCTGLKELVIPDNILSIGNSAFHGCSNLTKILLSNNLTHIGSMAFSLCTGLTEVVIPDNVVTIDSGVFQNCKGLTSITLNKTLTTIGASAFRNCEKLQKLDIPKSVTSIGGGAFAGCATLKEIVIPDGITTLNSTFEDCTSLSKVTLPETITTIGAFTFLDCKSLASVIIPASVTKIDSSIFDVFPKTIILLVYEGSYGHTYAVRNNFQYFTISEGQSPEIIKQDGVTYFVVDGNATATNYDGTVADVTIPETIGGYPVTKINAIFEGNTKLTAIKIEAQVTEIDLYTFKGCTALKTVILPDSLTQIRGRAFYGCSSLTDINIPDNVSYIDTEAFYECSSLTTIKLPDNLISIPYGCFYNCQNLKSVEGGSKLKGITGKAFYNCRKLAHFTIPDTVTSIGSYAFFDCVLYKDLRIPYGVTKIWEGAFRGCASVTEITIPDTVTEIARYGFSDMSNLKSIVIPDSVTTMNTDVFNCCYSLSNVTLGKGLSAIPMNTFNDCVALKSIIIPGNIKTIGSYAFDYCISLENVQIENGVETISLSAFGSQKIKRITIPQSVISISPGSIPKTTLHCVYKDSYAHQYAQENGVLYYILDRVENPEIAYGTSISGTITDTEGTAISGVTVEILYDDGTVKKDIITDSNGAYSFDYAEIGRYTIRATDTEGNTASELVSVKRMNVFDVYLAGDTDLVLKNGYSVAGTVTPETASVTISDTKGNILKSADTTNGTFTFENIPRGTYLVKAENEVGSATTEIYVSNEDVIDITLEIKAQSATITGDTKIENRDGTFSKKNWVDVTLIDSNGSVVTNVKTDPEGRYTFDKVSVGSYKIVATTTEFRPDYSGKFDKSFELKGFGHIDVTELITYTVDTIVLREDKVNLTSVSGKVTANGTTQDCQVILTNENGDQISVFVTDNNGKYNFINIPDGMYCITAITKNDGMGFTVITIESGVVHGDTDIKVAKADKISKREQTLLAIPDCDTKEDALLYKEAVLAEKTFYDSLSEKERKQLSEEWIEKLFKLVDLISDSSIVVTDGVTVENEESIISSDEITILWH